MNKSSPQSIRIGVIGCGQFMSRQHIQTIARSQRLTLQNVADINPAALKKVVDRYQPNRHGFRWQEVLEDPQVDVLVVGVLPELHPEIARAAIDRRLPVYVEKPLGPTVEECRLLASLSRTHAVPLAVGFNRRFAPATPYLKGAMQTARMPISLFYRLVDDGNIRPFEQRWKNVDRLLTETVHIFDYLSFLLESDPVEMYARECRLNDILLTMAFANGSQATILTSSHGSLAQPKEHLEAVLGGAAVEMDDFVELRSYGAVGLPPVICFPGRPYDGCDNRHVKDFADHGLSALIAMRQHYEAIVRKSGVLSDDQNSGARLAAENLLGNPPPPQINYAADKGWGLALEAFCAAAMAGDLPANANASDGGRATACALAARQSITEGRPIKLDSRTWSIEPRS